MIQVPLLVAVLLATWVLWPAPLHAARPSVAVVCDSLLVNSLGLPWSPAALDGRAADGSSCVVFRSEYGGLWFKSPVEQWVERCERPLAGGRLERRVHQVGEDPQPRGAVVFWSIGALSAAGSSAEPLASLRQEVLDSLARRLGPARARPSGTAFDGLGRSRNHPFEFATSLGVLRVYSAEDDWGVDSLLVAHWFAPLAAEEHAHWDPEPTSGPELPFEAQRTRERRREAAEALGSRDRALRAALEEAAPSPAALGAVQAALAEAMSLRAGERRDLLQWASHLWLASLDSLTTGSDAARDRAAHVEAALTPLGVTFHAGEDGIARLYRGSLATTLMQRLGRSPWADHAFADRLGSGWDSAGTGAYQWDAYRFIIDRGESFLRDHPRSTAGREVAFLVAQAHETAWSLAIADGAEGGNNPELDRAGAGTHRRRALELYRGLVGEALPEAGLDLWWSPDFTAEPAARHRDLRRRMWRLEFDIDTESRAHVYFSC